MTKTVSDLIADRVIRHVMYLERFKSHEAAEILRTLDKQIIPGLIERLERRLKWIQTRGVDKSVQSTQRLRDLVKFTKDYVKAGARRLYNELAADLKDLAVSEAKFSASVMQANLPAQIPFEFVQPPPNLLRSIVTSRPMHGRVMRDWFDNLATSTQQGITRQLNIGLAGGETVPQMVARVREATGLLRNQAQTVVRTATTHVTNHARGATYEANQDVIKGWQFVATLDTRTSAICRAEDGKTHKVGEGTKPPLHYNCRSTTVPVLKSWKELGIDAKELPPSTRSSMNGQVPENLNYGQWLKQQPKHIQVDALGKTRAELFRRGEYTVQDFVGNNGKRLTLDELLAKDLRIVSRGPVTPQTQKLLGELSLAKDSRTKKRIREALRDQDWIVRAK